MVISRFWGNFGHFLFQEYFGHFLCFGSILVIFRFFGVFWSFFWISGDILFIFGFWGYFGHFVSFGVILVILGFGGILVFLRF